MVEKKVSLNAVQIARAKQVKKQLLEYLMEGYSVQAACDAVGRSPKTYEYYRKTDEEFRLGVERIRNMTMRGELNAPEVVLPPFPEFSEKYIGSRVFAHQKHWVDLLEGVEPSDVHPSITYEAGDPDLLIVNTPPEHCATPETPILTDTRGWVTVGDVTTDDMVYDRDGYPTPIAEVWESEVPVPVYDVVFDTGDVVRTDGGHKWVVDSALPNSMREVTTEWLLENPRHHHAPWRVTVAAPTKGTPIDLPVDPYILGVWLGDGDSNGYKIATSEDDLPSLERALTAAGYTFKSSPQRGGYSVYVYGMTKGFRKLGLIKNKHIPNLLFMASYEQRLALLQGLMDTDGTITVKDSRARFVQRADRVEFNRDVYRLIASLGFKPHFKTYESTSYANGIAYNQPMTEIGFRVSDVPVFRLERKAARQKPLGSISKSRYRSIREIRPAGKSVVKCITALSDDNTYLLGDGLIRTHNAKSTTITVNYAVYRICQNPNIRIIIVSKTQAMAQKFLLAIKNRLTHPRYQDLHIAFGPPGGFEKNSDSWKQDMIYLSSEARDSGEKDPTVQAIGVRGHIYGARADLIIMDDCVDGTNAHEFEKQIDWIQSEVMSRIDNDGGKLLVIGTRLRPKDLYSELRDPMRYPDETSPWTYFAQPAVLEFKENSEDWVTLWPKTNVPPVSGRGSLDANGLYTKWDGPALSRKRQRMSPNMWAMVYQQQQVHEDSIFPQEAVKGVINGARNIGLIPKGKAGNRPNGMDGLVVVAGLDPAMAGYTAAVCLAVDISTQKRYLLDVSNVPGMKPDSIRQLIKDWTDRYNVSEWRVEKNAFQAMLTQDREVREYLTLRGATLKEHHTGTNKWDVDFGVASLSNLFYDWENDNNLIEFPSTHASEGLKALIEQLVTWYPDAPKQQKTDCVMAFWFAELAARDRLSLSNYTMRYQSSYSMFHTKYDKRQQMTVSVADLMN